MSDLHDLSAPVEESQEDIVKKEVETKQIEKIRLKENLKESLEGFKQKYLKKLFLSVGIAFTLGILVIWILGVLLSPKDNVSQNRTEDKPAEQNSQDNYIKYTKFDGHQYFFYFPENYGFLNRTRNDDLNEVVFSDENGNTVFILQEFEAENHEETTLDSIYSYIFTTVTPNENTEVNIGENTFKKRVYETCTPSTTKECKLQNKTYYSSYINGIIIIFEVPDELNSIEDSILNTFTKNIADSQILSAEYIEVKLQGIKNKLQAQIAFGVPLKIEEVEDITEITWQAVDELDIKLGFDTNKILIHAHGIYRGVFKFNMNKIKSPIAKTAYENLIADSRIQNEVLKTNPDAEFFMDDIVEDNFWEITVTSSAKGGGVLIAEYTIDKTTSLVEKKVKAED